MSHLAYTWPASSEPSESPLLPSSVTEQTYWAEWYEHPDLNLEWHEGRLEEVPVSDQLTVQVYFWLLELLLHYLRRHPDAQILALETGFRLALPDGKVSIRKPDLGFIHRDNPIQRADTERSYTGIPDLLIEALSDSTQANRQRDEVTKKGEYAAVGVREYYILHHDPASLAFYTRAASGLYVPIPLQEGVIHSRVFPGFRFRRADLQRRPSLTELRKDPIYAHFVLPEWREAEAVAAQARAIAEQAQTQAEQARAQAEQERHRREVAEAQANEERQQRQQERQQREAAEARADEERKQRQQERQQREAAEARLAELEALLAQGHTEGPQ
ncbi:MAG: Uma2 family endonuclease [Chromatiaceae bacterium]|nr:Uma2 family endonuclease [Chromatiaceae bacterium]